MIGHGDEVRDMIGKALDGEPPVGLDYETVLGEGRRRRTRRHLGIVAGAVLGVVAVAGTAVTVNQLTASPANAPAGRPTTTTTSPTAPHPPLPAGCRIRTAGSEPVSESELAESGRLTAAFIAFRFPALPAGVSMEPVKPEFCAGTDRWQTTITLSGPKGTRSLIIDVLSRRGQAPGECNHLNTHVECKVSTLADGTVLRSTVSPAPNRSAPTLVNLDAWRPDGTIVRLLETGGEQPAGAAPRILGDNELRTIVTTPELKVNWPGSGRGRPPEASSSRAAELTAALAELHLLPQGMSASAMPGAIAPAMAFYPSQGDYKLNADLIDAKGKGNLFIDLSPPGVPFVADSCTGKPDCEVLTLPDQRTVLVTRPTIGQIKHVQLSTTTPDGATLLIMVSNQSAAAGRTSGPSRPDPPLAVEDLLRIASIPGLHW